MSSDKFTEFPFRYFVTTRFTETGSWVVFHRRDGSVLGSFFSTGESEAEDYEWTRLAHKAHIDYLNHCLSL